MIVRNEEANLKEWLSDATAHVDEVVIVDTGSDDGTLAFLQSLPVKTLRQPWAHDFALHRNHGLDHVTSDWVLILDADERLSEEDWLDVRSLLQNERTMAYLFGVKNFHTPGDLSSFDMMHSYRLFRNGYGIRYEGSVHNQLAPAIEKACVAVGMGTEHAGISVEHFGYALENPAMEAKRERIYEMVKRQLAQTPNDPYYLYHLLIICLAMEKFNEARETTERLAIDNLRPELQVQAFCKAAQVAMHFDENERARDYVRNALQIQPKTAYLHYLRSNILYQMHRYSEGLRSAYRALEYSRRPAESSHAVHVSIDEYLINVGIGYLLSEEYTSALSYFQEALRKNPSNQSAHQYSDWIQREGRSSIECRLSNVE